MLLCLNRIITTTTTKAWNLILGKADIFFLRLPDGKKRDPFTIIIMMIMITARPFVPLIKMGVPVNVRGVGEGGIILRFGG